MEEKKVVLIVDDDPFSVLLMNEYLKNFHIKIYNAKNGKEAIEKSEIYNPDIIITDILMPVIGGIKVLKTIKKQNPNIKILAETALATREKLEEIENAGFDAVITKPYRKEVFQNVFKKIMKNYTVMI